MSSRALRKLQNRNGLEDLSAGVTTNESEERQSDDSIEDSGKPGPINPFALLNNSNDDENDDAAENSDEKPVVESKANKASKKKKKKSKKSKQKSNMVEEEADIEKVNDDEEIVDEFDSNLNSQSKQKQKSFSKNSAVAAGGDSTKPILSVEHRWLDAANEVKRIFGSSVVQRERRNPGNRGVRRSTWLVTPRENWPLTKKAGLSMDLQENRNGVLYFVFTHSKSYQQVQFQFLDGVESHNPQKLINLLHEFPFHIDTLLQVSEIFKINEDLQSASQLIERALYVFETNFHPSFSLTQGTCRLDFRYPENRSFFLCLFHHLTFVGRRGCYRTALEICKLILSLDPDNDPLCVLLMIDFYALRSSQYSYLVQLCRTWEGEKRLSQLPNFSFSLALALFHEANESRASMEEADQHLQEALIMYPTFLIALLDKCSIVPDQRVTKSSFFNLDAQKTCPEGLARLINLYVGRCNSCWKEAAVVPWLERNVGVVLDRVERRDPCVEEFKSKRVNRYKGMPRNIYRHIVLSDIKEAAANLPHELTSSAVLSHDPLPPTESVIRYQRPERPRRAPDSSNPFTAFLRSLNPNYNVNEPPGDDDEAEGAVGGRLREGTAERQSINGLMDALRALINNIDFVGAPAANGHQNPDEEPPQNFDDDEEEEE